MSAHTKSTGPRVTGDAIADAINGELIRQRRAGSTPAEAATTVGRALARSIGRMIGATHGSPDTGGARHRDGDRGRR